MYDPAFTALSGLGLVLVLIALPLQWRADNLCTVLNLSWCFAGTLVVFVNSIVWWDSYEERGTVWCGIAVKITTAVSTGLAASSLCINRRLAGIARCRSVARSQRQKRNSNIVDLALVLGTPVIVMATSYVFQPHRYDIVQGMGCVPIIMPCLGSVFLVWLWPVAISLISIGYGLFAVRFLVARRAEVRSILRSSPAGLDLGNYVRLIGMATADIIFGLPLSVYILVQSIRVMKAWTSWSSVHQDWSHIVTYNDYDILPKSASVVRFYLARWLSPLMCFIAFLFFGVGDEALKQYGRWLRSVTGLFVVQRGGNVSPGNSTHPPLKLGSTVVHPMGSAWMAPDDTDDEVFGADSSVASPRGALAVSVTVQREVV